MLGPSLHYTGYTLGNLASIQGMTIMVGAAMGPTAAAVAATARTLARLGPTASIMLNAALLPEYSARFGRGEEAAVRRLFAFHAAAALAIAVAYLGLMLPLGETVYRWWTKGDLPLPPLLLALLALGSAIEIVWTALQAPAVAANRMRLTGVCFIVASLAGLAALWLARGEGIVGFGWVSLGISMLMIGAALTENRRLLAPRGPR